MVLWELFRLLDGLANRPFCVSKISRFQLKSNWTVCKKLLASNSKIVCKSRLILSKAQLFFCNGWFRNCIISKELTLTEFLHDVALRELLRHSDGVANRLLCWSDISRVQLQFNWTVRERLLASDVRAVT